jgi:catechol 2,3-dioxygenase-like lactoylglutathione lyase family enzyme
LGGGNRGELSQEEQAMKLTHSCIITENIERLREFYEGVLQIEPQTYGDSYVEFPTECGTLSLFSLTAHEELAPGSARSAANRSLELEFQVADVDEEYERLQEMEIEWVKPPTTQAWGNRSIYFRDPDGNLINFYSRVSNT